MNSSRGFSFVEVVMSVTLLSMLAGVVLPISDIQGRKARDATRRTDLETVRTALETYHREHGHYPSTNGQWSSYTERCGRRLLDGPDGYIPDLAPKYLARLPVDPSHTLLTRDKARWAGYQYCSDGVDYKFRAIGTPERFPEENPFRDPLRGGWVWQVSSSGASQW